jgi:hypothetical protein
LVSDDDFATEPKTVSCSIAVGVVGNPEDEEEELPELARGRDLPVIMIVCGLN